MRPSIRPALRRVSRPLPTISEAPTSPKATPVGGQKNRTSKTSQKHVDLPTAAQDAALPDDDVQRSFGERLSSEQRDEAGYQRLTAYRVCDEFNTGLLSTFLKREHAVTLRLVRPSPPLATTNSLTGSTMKLSTLSTIYRFGKVRNVAEE